MLKKIIKKTFSYCPKPIASSNILGTWDAQLCNINMLFVFIPYQQAMQHHTQHSTKSYRPWNALSGTPSKSHLTWIQGSSNILALIFEPQMQNKMQLLSTLQSIYHKILTKTYMHTDIAILRNLINF